MWHEKYIDINACSSKLKFYYMRVYCVSVGVGGAWAVLMDCLIMWKSKM